MKLGKRWAFIDLLHKENMTVSQLSQLLGYKDKSGSTVYKWIYRKSEPNAACMLRLCKIFNVSAEEILSIFADDLGGEK